MMTSWVEQDAPAALPTAELPLSYYSHVFRIRCQGRHSDCVCGCVWYATITICTESILEL